MNITPTLEGASLVAQTVKNLPAKVETQVQSLGWKDILKKEMPIHLSILAWEIPWTEQPGGLQCMASQRAGHNLATEHTCSLTPWVHVYHTTPSHTRTHPNQSTNLNTKSKASNILRETGIDYYSCSEGAGIV